MTVHRGTLADGHSARYGIAFSHWKVFKQYAADRHYVLAVRGGKQAAVPWIEQGFPAKPMTIGAKIDPACGLLIAHNQSDLEKIYEAGYYVLRPPEGRSTAMQAYNPQGNPEVLDQQFDPRDPQTTWARLNVVIEPQTMLPVTSDYDLAAVIDTREPNYGLTFSSMSLASQLGGKDSKSNIVVDAVSRELNRLFHSVRIMHGSQAQHTGDMANKNEEALLLFHPDGRVEYVWCDTAIESGSVLQEVMVEYHPNLEYAFNQ